MLKGAEAECKALKDEIKRRGLLEATGGSFAIRVSVSGRLDVAAVKHAGLRSRARASGSKIAASATPSRK